MVEALPHFWSDATRHLGRTDVVLKRIIADYPNVKVRLKKDSFTTLARAITGQQISVKAAESIWGRLVVVANGSATRLDASKILGLRVSQLRSCGLSERKAEYMQNLAAHFFEKKITASALARSSDADAKARLIELKGIGPWTADMYLMFNLWRPDILPLGDVGLLRAVELNYFKGRKTPLAQIKRIAAPWSPYSTVATWYLWRSLDPIPVEY